VFVGLDELQRIGVNGQGRCQPHDQSPQLVLLALDRAIAPIALNNLVEGQSVVAIREQHLANAIVLIRSEIAALPRIYGDPGLFPAKLQLFEASHDGAERFVVTL
jgi:hypothetical protein